jgi:hypothetical protein
LRVSPASSLSSLNASADYFPSNQRKSSIDQIILPRSRFYVVFTKNVPLTARWGYPGKGGAMITGHAASSSRSPRFCRLGCFGSATWPKSP